MHVTPIHPDDDMFQGSHEHYYSVGSQMADFVSHATELAGAHTPIILELPCGYGRVTRHLATRFDPTKIHVADIMVPSVDFCIGAFGVVGHYVAEPVYEYANIASEAFDVAALGSLVTHLSSHNARTVIVHFFSKLKSGAVGVVTTHGEKSREHLGIADCYQVGEAARQHLLSSFDANQYGFVNYPTDHSLETKTVDYIGDSYGISIIPTDWIKSVCEENNLSIIEHWPGAWDGHQDVFFIRKY
ncbi:class I SAM-dependent methyltransferase [Paraburkholderia lacunae]|uniref:Class I SAM-dependent methyltransferase n=2 Tax=Paraburkholderia lacunae TaxID=2211104 RepID=A0A370MZM2_9BURK|nr:class I SAM-dependent methyltransferase [Paraburkholderia lacunae]